MTTQNLTPALSTVLEKIFSAKGNFVKVAWKSNPSLAASFKKAGIELEKRTVAIVRAGIDYANLASVKNAIEAGERGAVESLPWGQWHKDSSGKSWFPFVIEHKGELYLRLYPSASDSHKAKSSFFMGGEAISKEQAAGFLTPSEAKKLLEPSEEKPACFTIKLHNLIELPASIA